MDKSTLQSELQQIVKPNRNIESVLHRLGQQTQYPAIK